jgi:hypothetical protein
METEFFFSRKRPGPECDHCSHSSIYAFMAYMQNPLHFKINHRKVDLVCKIRNMDR